MTPDEKAREITGPCSCHEAYTGRGLVDPNCAWHDFAPEIAVALSAARREGIEVAAKVADEQKMLDAVFDVDLAWNGACHDIVVAIRALKDKQP